MSAPYPVSTCRTADSGATAVSFGSWKPVELFSASTPTTVNSAPPTVTCWSSGSVPGNSSSATVCPITTTRRPWASSSAVNGAPVRSGVFEAPNQPGVVPTNWLTSWSLPS